MNLSKIKLPPGIKMVGRRKRIAEPTIEVVETPSITPVEVLPPLEVGSLSVTPYRKPTLEEFTVQCDGLLGELKSRLAIPKRRRGKPTGEIDYQQWYAAVKAAWFTGVEKKNWQVIAPTGQGKTYFLAGYLRILRAFWPEQFDGMQGGLLKGKMPWIVVQPAKSVTQCRMVFAKFDIHDAIITTLAALRNTIGDNMIEWRTVVVNQQPVVYPFWKMESAPIGIIVDESQQLKNESTQSEIIESAALSGIPVGVMSATPYSRVCQAKVIAAAILCPQIGGTTEHPIYLNPKLWASFAKEICGPRISPNDWSPVALERLQKYLEPQTIRWSIDYPHAIRTKMVAMDFPSAESRQRYNEAFEAWQELRLQYGKNPLVGMAEILVAIQKFCQVAEEEGVEPRLRYALDLWAKREAERKPISVIFGFAYRTSCDKAVELLRQILGEKDFKKRVAQIVGGVDCTADHNAFQADSKYFLCLTIACGGAALSLDHNEQNKRQRYMFASGVWNDIQMAQLAGRTQRLMTQSASYFYLCYFKNTMEAKKIHKVRRKISAMKVVTTKIRGGEADDEEGAGVFVEDIDEISHVDAGRLEAGSDLEEEEAASKVIGTTIQLDWEEDEDEIY